MSGAVVNLDAVRAQLATCDDVSTVMEIRSKADTMARYLREQQGAEQDALRAMCIARRAERRLGELLAEMPKAKGTRTAGGGKGAGGSIVRPPADAPTLADHGISKSESSRWQKIARIPEERFELHLATSTTFDPPTRASVLRLSRKPTPRRRPLRLSPLDKALSAWANLEESDRRQFCEKLGLVSEKDLDRLHEQRLADPDFASFIQLQRLMKAAAPFRGQVMATAVVDGVELAMLNLGVDWNVTPDSLNRAYRARAKKMHPDTGGSTEKFARLQVDRDLVASVVKGT